MGVEFLSPGSESEQRIARFIEASSQSRTGEPQPASGTYTLEVLSCFLVLSVFLSLRQLAVSLCRQLEAARR